MIADDKLKRGIAKSGMTYGQLPSQLAEVLDYQAVEQMKPRLEDIGKQAKKGVMPRKVRRAIERAQKQETFDDTPMAVVFARQKKLLKAVS